MTDLERMGVALAKAVLALEMDWLPPGSEFLRAEERMASDLLREAARVAKPSELA